MSSSRKVIVTCAVTPDEARAILGLQGLDQVGW